MRVSAIACLLGGLVFSASVVLPNSARGQSDSASKPIGKVISATGSIVIEHVTAVIVQANLGRGQVKVGDFVYLGDVVETGVDGRIGITFNDGTTFNVFKDARMVLNEFVYDPNSQSNASVMSLIKGTFAFIAGKIAKSGEMKVGTPVGVIGIRGTTPHVEISADGTVAFSTLIEEGKDKVTGSRAGVGNRRQAVTTPSPAEQTQPNRIKSPGINLNICRGC